MVELFYVREVTAQYSLANFHDVLVFLKHIGPNYTFRDAGRILINVIGLISVLCIVVSFWFREVLNIIIPPLAREENRFCRRSSVPTVQQWTVHHWYRFYRSEVLALIIWASGGEMGDRHGCPTDRLSYRYCPSPHPNLLPGLFVWRGRKSRGKNEDLSIPSKLVKIFPRK